MPLEALDADAEVVRALLDVLHAMCVPLGPHPGQCTCGTSCRSSGRPPRLHLVEHVLNPRAQDGRRKPHLQVGHDALHIAALRIHVQGFPQPPHGGKLVALPQMANAKPRETAEVPWLELEHSAAVLDRLVKLLREEQRRRPLVPALGVRRRCGHSLGKRVGRLRKLACPHEPEALAHRRIYGVVARGQPRRPERRLGELDDALVIALMKDLVESLLCLLSGSRRCC
mmetsp:Transcript_24266/g.50459  ORF Transcript_24266/g.50459 Transcript_24266/m.50459 type:complete len:227 (-) Transcript_24266:446-1126(-)